MTNTTPIIVIINCSILDKLPHSLLLHILSQLDDSADVARCRVASKAFDGVFPGLRSINLICSLNWYSSKRIKPFKTVFLDHISQLETVESVSIALDGLLMYYIDHDADDLYLTGEDFTNHWLPRASGSLKSLSISDHYSQNPSDVLPLISAYYLLDEPLNDFNKCFPNLQFLKLLSVKGLKHPKIHLLSLKTCLLDVLDCMESLSLIAPSLMLLKFKCYNPRALHVEAPMLSHFHIGFYEHGPLTLIKLDNLKTLWLESSHCGSLLSAFLVIESVDNLTLESRHPDERDHAYPKLSLQTVLMVFPNVSSLCIRSGAWSELEACLNTQGWEILDGTTGLKTICAYLKFGDPSLTFSSIACVLDQCVDLLEVKLLIHKGVTGTVFESFMSKCMLCWPGLKWRWGIWSMWSEDIECQMNHGTSS
ncbi:hypothetical protein SSX86_008457 [Deinandra increscens subsp. villosa]|uniref:F-box domain-containing protein n=1 Tax=Deinandra increscens subsp. villosa TaxID=3103831 RepID=A0AAP0DBA9_9ASTR